jgi:hypothetical protein
VPRALYREDARPSRKSYLLSIPLEFRNTTQRRIKPFCGASTAPVLVDHRHYVYTGALESGGVAVGGCELELAPLNSGRARAIFHLPRRARLARLVIWNGEAGYLGPYASFVPR